MIPGALETNVTVTSNVTRVGTLVTAGSTAHTKGTTWDELIASTSAAAEGIYIKVVDVGVSNTATSMLMDIGTGGSGSETVLLPDLLVGYAGPDQTMGRTYFFPVAIPSGTRISARCQALIASDTARVAIWLAQSVQHLEGASSVEAIGEDTTNSEGTTVTSGNNAWAASWTSIGSVSSDVNCIMPGFDADSDTVLPGSDDQWILKLGYGTNPPGSGGTEIDAIWYFATASQENTRGVFPNTPVYADISSGDNIYVNIAGNDPNEPIGVVVHAMECPVASGGGITGVSTLVGGTGLVG